MTYSFCQTSCSEYRDMSMYRTRYAAIAAAMIAFKVQTLVRAFIFARPFLLPDQHDWKPSFKQHLKSSLSPEELTQ